MPLIPYASFLAGAILSLVMPVGLLIVITAYFHFARKRLPEPSSPAVGTLDPGVGAPTSVSHEAPRSAPRNPVSGNPGPGGSGGSGGSGGGAPDSA